MLDLSGPYRAAFDAAAPQAKQVTDPFHVVRLGNDALDEVRRRIQNQTLGHRGHKHDPLYRARKLLVSASENITDNGRTRLRGLLDAGDPYGEVRDAWHRLPVKTLPKSAFTAVDWHYEPSALTGLAAGHPFCGGFELWVRLHRHENRYHLQRSLQVGGLRSSRRVVVIASARDIFDPESWVRCLVVDADTLYLPKQSLGWVAVRGSDPSSVDAPVVHRRRHKDVPDGAVWLIVPTSAYCPPAAAWGEATERLDQQTRATIEAALTADCPDIDNEDYVRHWVKWNRKVTLAIWAVLGPGTFVMAILALSLAPAFLDRLPAAFGTFVEVGIVTWVWYSRACAAVSGFACGHLLLETLAVRTWRRRENQAHSDWKGGTDECLVVGRLLRRGPSLRPKQWAQHCDQALPQ